jgi:neutral amino acid transport system permease protein
MGVGYHDNLPLFENRSQEVKIMVGSIIQHALFGIVTGSILLLGTLGFTMVERLDGFVNISHGQLIAIGAYSMWFCYAILGLSFIIAAILAIAISALAALLTYRVFFRPVLRFAVVTVIITSCGVGFFLNGVIEYLGGPNVHALGLPIYQMVRLGNIPLIPKDFVAVVVVGMVSIVIMHLFLQKTKLGKAFRAVSSNRMLAVTKGINLGSLSTFVWLLAGGTAGLAGILFGVVGNLTPDMGWHQTMVIMSVAVLGGLGNTYGIMIAAFIVGLTMDVGILIFPSGYRPALAFAIIIIALLLKPEGIFGE